MLDTLKKYLYEKQYILDEHGRLVLANPELLLEYVKVKSESLFETYRTEKQKIVKLEIFDDFFRILKNDIKYIKLPEMSGTFPTQKEKDKYINLTILARTFSSYLGNIFANYHTKLLNTNRMIEEELSFSGIIIDYNDLYLRATRDYFMTLQGKEENIGYKYKNLNPKEFVDISTGQTHKIKTGKITDEINRPIMQRCYLAAFAFPVLIEKLLIANIFKKRINELFKRLDDLLFYKVITLTEDEKILYKILRPEGNKVVSGKSELQVKTELYKMFLKYRLANEQEDKFILTGNDEKLGKLSLNGILKTKYSKKIMKSEYRDLLIKIFDTEQLNYRNNIVHGNEPFYDCYNITFSSVLLQLIWDLGKDEEFIKLF